MSQALVRAQIATAATAQLAPDAYTLIPYGRNVDGLDRPLLLVTLDERRPPGVACSADVWGATVYVVSPLDDLYEADDQLDGLLDLVVAGVDAAPTLFRSAPAERIVYLDRFSAWALHLDARE